jgi:hypothetical protein
MAPWPPALEVRLRGGHGSAQVLASELLPPTVGDQALTDMLRSLPDSPETLDRVVAAVFASSPPVPASAAGAADAAGSPLPLQVCNAAL